MKEDNVVSLSQYVLMKDLEDYANALVELTVKLQVENQQLKKKLEHAEELLKNAPVLEIKRHELR